MISLTPRQQDALTFIRSHVAEHGKAPTYRMLDAAISGGKAYSGRRAFRVIADLVERGRIARKGRRSYTLTPDGWGERVWWRGCEINRFIPASQIEAAANHLALRDALIASNREG